MVTEGVLEATTTSVGDELHLDLQAASSDTAAVVGTLSEFPTVDPVEEEAVIIDLATFQMMNYRLAAPIIRPNEYWLAINNIDGPRVYGLTLAVNPQRGARHAFDPRRRLTLFVAKPKQL